MTEKLDSDSCLNTISFGDRVVPGTLLWYYAICKREVWLASRALYPDQEHELLDYGRFIHEIYSEERKEIKMEGVKMDLVEGKIVCEVKSSSKFLEAAKLQVGYYLYRLEKLKIKARGEILVPKEGKRIKVLLNDSLKKKIEKAIKNIIEIVSSQNPPPPKFSVYCKKCAYSEFCWEGDI